MSDWLEGNSDDERENRLDQAREFAKLYLIFEETARGREIMEHWEKTILMRTTPPSATVQEYAWNEAQRELVQGIKRQIDLAKEVPGG